MHKETDGRAKQRKHGANMKAVEMDAAIKLRGQGLSLNEIRVRLSVSKNSVSRWVHNVELTDAQKSRLSEKGLLRPAVELRRKSRLLNEQQKRDMVEAAAHSEIPPLDLSQLRLIGTMLYWGEGSKTQRRASFANSDPKMIRVMMLFFRLVCRVPDTKFRAMIHIHESLDHKKAEEFWSTITDIPLAHFYKTYRKPNISSKNKKHSLPHGTLDIYASGVQLFLTISGWTKGVYEMSELMALENGKSPHFAEINQ